MTYSDEEEELPGVLALVNSTLEILQQFPGENYFKCCG